MVRRWPADSVTGRETEELEKALFENDSDWMVTDLCPVEVMVSGWDETLPLEPLKLSAVVETAIPLLC